MRNRQWDKLTTERCKQFCNEWCCPCNDGSTGCYANDFYEMLCDNSTTAHIFRGEEDLFDKLQEESYDKMVESYDNPEIYEEFCIRFVDELCEKHEEKPKNFWESLVETYNRDIEKLDELYTIEPEEDTEPLSEEEPEPISNVPDIPVEWIKEKLEKEEYRTFLVDYIEWRSCLHWLLEAWEEENETNR